MGGALSLLLSGTTHATAITSLWTTSGVPSVEASVLLDLGPGSKQASSPLTLPSLQNIGACPSGGVAVR